MSSYVKTVIDRDSNIIYPRTLSEAILMQADELGNRPTLQDVLDDLGPISSNATGVYVVPDEVNYPYLSQFPVDPQSSQGYRTVALSLNYLVQQRHWHSNKAILDNVTAAYTVAEQTKLSGVATGAEVNQLAFSNITVGATTVASNSKTSTVTFVAGTNVTIAADNTLKTITISANDTEIDGAQITSGIVPPERLGSGSSIGAKFLRGDSTWQDVPIPSGYTAGSTSVGFVNYNGTTKTTGQWYGGTANPSSTTRLNFDGYLYATKFTGTDATSAFIGKGVGLTDLVGDNIATGTVAAARLGSGTSITTKFLRGDNTWQTIAAPTGLSSGSAETGFIQYNGTTATAGQWDGGTTTPTGTTRINYGGYLYATRIYGAVYNDYAEFMKMDEALEPGDVVIKNPNGEGYLKSDKLHDKRVVGVVSDSYGHCLGSEKNMSLEENNLINAAIGLAGRVYVKVVGNVEVGDLLVASDYKGVATASTTYVPGTVVGKALEVHKTTDGISRIQMLIMNM
jgi:hypothetical protein